MDDKTKELLSLLRNHPQKEPSLSFKKRLKHELRQRVEKVERKKRYIKIGNIVSLTTISLILLIWLVSPSGNELLKNNLNSLLGNNTPNYGDVDESDNYLEVPEIEEIEEDQLPTFPESVELTYKELEWETLKKDDLLDWVKLEERLLGHLYGYEIIIELYAGNDDMEIVHGVITYNTETFTIHNIGYVHDMESIGIEVVSSSYGEDEVIYLIGVVGSPTLGYEYIFYEENEDNWYSYHHWGKPELIDIHEKKEVLMQFEGKGLQPPNVSILSWGEGNFVVADVPSSFQKQSVNIDENMLFSSTYRKENDSIVIDVTLFHESMEYERAYLFLDEKLIKTNTSN
ncbi:hypothetical protein ACERII_11740 [Evansella sp. AB-rgal1]|uniref:hypothetical protein n=1 Tax=Evansella sp. AB-rgal1 TaxID=3242696 RepID=UPI00359CE547